MNGVGEGQRISATTGGVGGDLIAAAGFEQQGGVTGNGDDLGEGHLNGDGVADAVGAAGGCGCNTAAAGILQVEGVAVTFTDKEIEFAVSIDVGKGWVNVGTHIRYSKC